MTVNFVVHDERDYSGGFNSKASKELEQDVTQEIGISNSFINLGSNLMPQIFKQSKTPEKYESMTSDVDELVNNIEEGSNR